MRHPTSCKSNTITSTSRSISGRFARLAVKRIDGQPGFSVRRMRRLDHIVLDVATNAVLWSEQGGDIDFGVLVKEVGCMAKAVINRSLIADESDAIPPEQVNPVSE